MVSEKRIINNHDFNNQNDSRSKTVSESDKLDEQTNSKTFSKQIDMLPIDAAVHI